MPVAVGNAVPEIREARRPQLRSTAGAAPFANSPSCCSRRAASGTSAWNGYVDEADRAEGEGQRMSDQIIDEGRRVVRLSSAKRCTVEDRRWRFEFADAVS